MKRVAVLRDPANPSGTGLMGAIQAVAPPFGVEVSSPAGLRETGEIERGVSAWPARCRASMSRCLACRTTQGKP